MFVVGAKLSLVGSGGFLFFLENSMSFVILGQVFFGVFMKCFVGDPFVLRVGVSPPFDVVLEFSTMLSVV